MYINADDAFKALEDGKVLKLIDDGRGYCMPGVLKLVDVSLVSAMLSFVVPNINDIVVAEYCLVNIIPVDRKCHCIVKFKDVNIITDFSMWEVVDDIQAELAKQASILSDEDCTAEEPTEESTEEPTKQPTKQSTKQPSHIQVAIPHSNKKKPN